MAASGLQSTLASPQHQRHRLYREQLGPLSQQLSSFLDRAVHMAWHSIRNAPKGSSCAAGGAGPYADCAALAYLQALQVQLADASRPCMLCVCGTAGSSDGLQCSCARSRDCALLLWLKLGAACIHRSPILCSAFALSFARLHG